MKHFIIILTLFSSLLCLAKEKNFKISKGTLDITNISGDVSITGVESNTLKISYSKIKWEKGCDLIIEKNNDKINVKVEQDSERFLSSPKCIVNFKITTPKKLKLRAKLSSSNISINGIESNCKIIAASGDITIANSIIKGLNGKSGSGNISAKGQLTNINLLTGSGEISIETSNNLEGATLNTKSGSGAVSAKGSFKTINLKTGSGNISAKGQLTNINLITGSGKISIETSKNPEGATLYTKSGSGTVSAKGSFKTINLKTGSGDLFVVMDKIINKVSLNAKSGSGDIVVNVPKSTKVKTNLMSSSGQLKNKVGYSDNAQVTIDAKTGSGDLTIESI